MYLIALVLVSLYLSLIENFIPKPFPWLKIGLSNIAVLIALEKFEWKMALEVVILRVLIQGIMLGTLFTPGFMTSFLAGVISTLFTILIYRFREKLSLVAISSISGFIHNLIQLIIMYLLLFRNVPIMSKSILLLIWGFLLLGVIAGSITGIITTRLNLRRSK